MKKTATLLAVAMVAGVAGADILWENNAPNAAWAGIVSEADPFGTGHGDIGAYTSGNAGGQYVNVNSGMQDWSAYAGQEWTISAEIYITAAQLADPDKVDAGPYFKVDTAQGGWTTLGNFTPDAWNTMSWSGTFNADASALTSVQALFLINHGGTVTEDVDYYIDNIKLEAVPEPATLGMVGLFGAAVMFVRRRFM